MDACFATCLYTCDRYKVGLIMDSRCEIPSAQEPSRCETPIMGTHQGCPIQMIPTWCGWHVSLVFGNFQIEISSETLTLGKRKLWSIEKVSTSQVHISAISIPQIWVSSTLSLPLICYKLQIELDRGSDTHQNTLVWTLQRAKNIGNLVKRDAELPSVPFFPQCGSEMTILMKM